MVKYLQLKKLMLTAVIGRKSIVDPKRALLCAKLLFEKIDCGNTTIRRHTNLSNYKYAMESLGEYEHQGSRIQNAPLHQRMKPLISIRLVRLRSQ